jgi:alpha-beta hydrolase superfamily lysophospholipase
MIFEHGPEHRGKTPRAQAFAGRDPPPRRCVLARLWPFGRHNTLYRPGAGQPCGYLPVYRRNDHLVTKDFAPILLVHGTNDQVVPYRQSVKLEKKISEIGGPGRAELMSFQEASHGDAKIKTWDSVMMDLNFVDKIMYPDGKHPYRNDSKIEVKILK